MTKQSTFSVGATFDAELYEPFEMGVVQWIRRFGDGDRPQLASGFWHITPEQAPEPFDLVSEGDETIHILEGRLRVEVDGGQVHELGAGSVASFNKGIHSRWTVLEPTVEFFVYS
jgi:hypothetical protein